MRLAWFSPVPPLRSGIASYSAMILPGLAARHEIDVFVDEDAWAVRQGAGRAGDGFVTLPWAGATLRPAHDFVPVHLNRPYELVVYQLGNARCHDYQWPYLLRYPGLVVLHDAHLHQARAAALLQHARQQDYRAEFAYCHPDAPADIAEWVISGLGNAAAGLYPLTGLVVDTARALAVHHPRLAGSLRDAHPAATITTIRHGAPDLTLARPERGATPADPVNRPVVFAAFGLITPEKRVPQILRALAAIRPIAPQVRLRLVGGTVAHYDLRADIAALEVGDLVDITGYVDDDGFDEEVRTADVCLCLRWPTHREASGPWYRCLSAGKPTIVNDLVHLVDVPTIDPRTWEVLSAQDTAAAIAAPPDRDSAVAVSLDILDEDHSLALAMRRLALDADLRGALGRAARRHWEHHHTLEHMTADYERALAEAAALPHPPAPNALPAHARADGTGTLRRLAGEMGIAVDLIDASDAETRL